MKSVAKERLALSQVRLEPEAARSMINRYRASRGLQPLKMERKLTRAAQNHSSDLARVDKISHTGTDGSNPWNRVKRTGYKPMLAAENVGAGQMSFSEVLQGWKDSPGHNKNLLLADATHMGIALKTNPNSRYQTFWTLVLGTPVNKIR
ncbi:MAG: CAP domain-containing protein [Pseudomonadota bacterium]